MRAYPQHKHIRKSCVVCAIYFLLKLVPLVNTLDDKEPVPLVNTLDGKKDDLIDALDLKYSDRILLKVGDFLTKYIIKSF